MKNLSKETEAILVERFGKDSIIALATASGGKPHVRSVDHSMRTARFTCLLTRYRAK